MKDRIVKIVPNAYQLTVRTFHSFCAFINRCEHKILNIPYDFNIIDEEDAKEILKYCLQRLGVDSDQQMEQILQFIADAKLLPYENKNVLILRDIGSIPFLIGDIKILIRKNY